MTRAEKALEKIAALQDEIDALKMRVVSLERANASELKVDTAQPVAWPFTSAGEPA